jgi:steroid 5-alpha reductase family enzyme
VGLLPIAIMTACIGAALSAIMATAWRIQQRTGNSGWVDVSWAFGTGAVALVAALAPIGAGPWPHWRQTMAAFLVACWCLRLGLHLTGRTRSIANDPRYRNLIEQWGQDASKRMFWFLQKQAAVGILLALAISLAAQNPDPALRVQDMLGVIILVVAVVGEAVADRQLRVFKSAPSNAAAVCDFGLWRWSRHPNYFFEWLAWVSYPVIAIDSAGHNPYGWLALLAPACMYWVLVHVSGIPPLEAHMLRSRGDAFRAYQRRTRPFLPFPPTLWSI